MDLVLLVILLAQVPHHLVTLQNLCYLYISHLQLQVHIFPYEAFSASGFSGVPPAIIAWQAKHLKLFSPKSYLASKTAEANFTFLHLKEAFLLALSLFANFLYTRKSLTKF